MNPNTDLVRGALEPVILEVIAGGATYGYEIAKAIEAEWDLSPEGRQRKHYRLTAAGRKERQALRKEWTEFTRTVNLILGIQHVQPELAW